VIEALLNGLWQGAFVVAVAAGVTALVPRRHAATRYAVWFAALVALAVVPLSGLLSLVVPQGTVFFSLSRTTTVATHAVSRAAGASGFWLELLWAAGASVCLLRLVRSYVRIARIVRLAEAAPAYGEGVFTSRAIAIPVAAGIVHPVILLPADFPNTLDAGDLRAIVAHERAHIARSDLLSNLAQRILEALLFFNPWAYAIGRQLIKEREAACDDWAVRASNDPARYAACLANLALRNPRVRAPLFTPSAIGSGRLLAGRIARILDGKAGQMKTNYIVLATAVALFAGLGFTFSTPRGLASTNCSSDVEVINPVMPNIPKSEAKAHPNAAVTLAVTVDAGGHPTSVLIDKSSGDPKIDAAVARAAAHSTYKPEMRNCKPVFGGQYLFHAEIGP
jgi:TonB family protein